MLGQPFQSIRTSWEPADKMSRLVQMIIFSHVHILPPNHASTKLESECLKWGSCFLLSERSKVRDIAHAMQLPR